MTVGCVCFVDGGGVETYVDITVFVGSDSVAHVVEALRNEVLVGR